MADIKKSLLISHLGMGDMIVMCGAVRYLATIYDEVTIICNDRYINNVSMMYNDNKKIKLLKYNGQDDEYVFIQSIIQEYTHKGDHHIFICGIHKNNYLKINRSLDNIQKVFYNDINLDISIMKEYFNIPDIPESFLLLKSIPKSLDIVFVHNSASDRKISIDVDRHINNNTLIVNPNINMYEINNKYYSLANKLLNKPLFFYKDIILNSKEVHLVDSSFSCLSALLIKNKNILKYLYTRNSAKYPDLFDNSWIYVS
jgi:hypothetical protein